MAGEAPTGAPGPVSLVNVQLRVRSYWESTGVPALTLQANPSGPEFRFTEGPPTANGAPHIGHVIARALKDVTLRYRRMRGDKVVTSMAGWDCHGLPVELEVEKRHGFKSKKEIEAYGVERFCEECRTGTMEVAAVWREMSARLGYWLDYDHAYLTMSPPYIESVWWSLKTLFDRGLLEKGHYVLPYCPRCETPLSSHEVAQGYKETTDPSVTVAFEVLEPSSATARRLLVWTTTPWTLPANLLVAAAPDLSYVAVRAPDGSEQLLAEAALPRYFPAGAEVVGRWKGSELAGWSYRPPFPYAGPGPGRYRVVLDRMIDVAEGTGIVHIAPSFGVDDQRVGAREGVGVWDPLDSRGVFLASVPPVAGKSFKAADAILIESLRGSGQLVDAGTVRHTYPFCWRCSTPLIYRAVDSWFVRTSRLTGELVANNATVRWIPAHLREGRFGNFLTEAKDWALSRNRFWGTPLPVWGCAKGHFTCVGGFQELAQLSGSPLPSPFDPHRVTVDRIEVKCPTCGAAARREPYTIDAWYDSGSAPFAQYHYPFDPGPFRPDAPLDFIAEGLDQTRGWFYTLLVLATALFHRPAYRACVSSGLVLDDTGQKMSKSKGNAVEPMGLLERLGGDAVRWGFFSTDYTEPLRVGEPQIRQAAARSLGTLLNVVEFYRQNATADGLPVASTVPAPSALLDQWLLSRLDATVEETGAALEEYDARRGVGALRELIDDLSTWYLRRSRPRFWGDGDLADRRRANDTLSFTLLTAARLLAPLAPFTAEYVHQEVLGARFAEASASVHLLPWAVSAGHRDEPLEEAMADLRRVVEVGRELRQRAQVKSRVPLPTLVVVNPALRGFASLGAEGETLIREELNVRALRVVSEARPSDFPESDWVVRQEGEEVRVALSRRPTPELEREGLLREALRRLQMRRKEMGLQYTDRVTVDLYAEGALAEALATARERIAEELLADSVGLVTGPAPTGDDVKRWDLDGLALAARLQRVAAAKN